MVIKSRAREAKAHRLGLVTSELVVAMGILAIVMIPLAFSFLYEQKLCRAYYFRAIAMEIIDGEMEVLRAGEWKVYQAGPQPYRVNSGAAQNLPPGQFVLTVERPKVRLEWVPLKKGKGGRVSRETTLKPTD